MNWKANYKLHAGKFSVSSVMQTADRGYVVSGTTKLPDGAIRNGFLIKMNAQRNLVSYKRVGSAGIPEAAHSVFTRGDGYLLIGSSNTDMLFLGLNSDGAVPGCNFFHNLTAKRVQVPKIAIRSLEIIESDPELPELTNRRLVRRASRLPFITSCP